MTLHGILFTKATVKTAQTILFDFLSIAAVEERTKNKFRMFYKKLVKIISKYHMFTKVQRYRKTAIFN